MGVLEWFERTPPPGMELKPERDREEREDMDAMRGWLVPPGTVGEALGRLPLLRSLTPEQLAQVTSTKFAPTAITCAGWGRGTSLASSLRSTGARASAIRGWRR